ncbi:MAG TPA: GNAT family N-acetyltransferase [Burkholderiaceae bacterium]|nr:GNAT family N-acetyltransferase [Burkholderiaceae bacterium]HMZ01245.1 GNAT family N-acetyltransferase [Burkholderiaceae bacterium]HNB45915.1 GNAT family N-acetyltransferase [Burkholderiaceae bacterium]HNG82757.1 GNAT family N-acetyltransferase [Burkholderiaceae bacterium]
MERDRDNDGSPAAQAGTVGGDGTRGPAELSAGGENLRVSVHDGPQRIDAAAWDALLAASPEPTPFLRHAWLAALHDSGSACAETGWQPVFLTVEDDALAPGDPGRLRAACPLYLKSHSWGEYVFDWAWADAYQRQGLAYYPKLLGAVPFTPVPGSRLLARDEVGRQALLAAIETLMRERSLSSAHLLFLSEAERASAESAGWLMRRTVQFHWTNRHVDNPAAAPYADFDDFLAGLQRVKRKKIAQERRYVREAGVRFRTLRGSEIGEADWDFFHHCYRLTYRAHRSTPYLTREFFRLTAQALPEHWLLFIAERGGQPIAASLLAIDAAQQVAWGRYWGAVEAVNCLHFEACYYQPLQWCIAQGWRRFEGGAQGEHKMARGLLPVTTWSAHRLAHPAFDDAVARYLAREGEGLAAYVDELREHSPFKAEAEPPDRPPQ